MTVVARLRIQIQFRDLDDGPDCSLLGHDTGHSSQGHTDPSRWTQAVYEAYDAQTVPLYFGVTGNTGARLRTHRRDSRWWPQADFIRVTLLPCRPQAQAFECRRIAQVEPAYNIKSTAAWREAAWRRAPKLGIVAADDDSKPPPPGPKPPPNPPAPGKPPGGPKGPGR